MLTKGKLQNIFVDHCKHALKKSSGKHPAMQTISIITTCYISKRGSSQMAVNPMSGQKMAKPCPYNII
jgi:hypothetical protein